MNFKYIFTVFFISSLSSYGWAGECAAPSVKLKDNKWKQISLPCNPRGNKAIEKIFGGAIKEALGRDGVLGTDWAVWQYDNGYTELKSGDPMKQGTGYWVIQASGKDVDVSMPPKSTSTIVSGGIPNVSFNAIELNTTPGTHTWNMMGNPFVVPVSDVTVTYEGIKECAGGININATCSLADSDGFGIVLKKLYRYNGDSQSYDAIEKGSFAQLKSWNGFWVATLNKADGKYPGLLMSRLKGLN